MLEKELIWIRQGYAVFAKEGPHGLKVEKLAQLVGKNKSSFYHFFADLEVFTMRLLDFHLERSREVAEKEAQAASESEFAAIIVEHKVDLFFNRQLRIHRDNQNFAAYFQKVNEISIPGTLPIWKKVIGLQENHYLAQMVLMLSLENFFLQITEETLDEDWVIDYLSKIKQMVQLFKKTNTLPALDGSV